jgi:hypothetical protein
MRFGISLFANCGLPIAGRQRQKRLRRSGVRCARLVFRLQLHRRYQDTGDSGDCHHGSYRGTITTSINVGQIGRYGSPFANNSGRNTENPPANQLTPSAGGTCAGDIRVIMEGTVGFWYKLYQGNKGGFRLGLQYSYFAKNGWSGNNNVAGAPGISPKAVDNMVWTSLRYYIP